MERRNKKKLNIIGAGGHGKVIADIALNCGYENIAFLDADESRTSCLGFPVYGPSLDEEAYRNEDFFVAIGNAEVREHMFEELDERGLSLVSLIHPTAVIGREVRIGRGTVVMAGTVINPDTTIGEGCIINTGATVDHDNCLSDFVHVSVGAHLAGMVSVGKGTWVGAGAVVSNQISLCGGCMIGAGAVVVKDIREPGVYIGVPARRRETI